MRNMLMWLVVTMVVVVVAGAMSVVVLVAIVTVIMTPMWVIMLLFQSYCSYVLIMNRNHLMLNMVTVHAT
jgi:hypothetical protein